jgi:hypothetical protein
MTSTIKVNNIQNQCGQNIINENSNTITIGASGDTIALASGASQTGFGREGSVDWQTGSIKTTTFTATSGEGYFVDTSSGAVTANLPAGSAGAIVSFADYTRTFQNNALTVNPNGSEKIGGVAASASLVVEGQAATFVYVDGTEGWINVQNAVTCGDFKTHIFTGPGTFTVTCQGNPVGSNGVEYLVVAGGGGGGSGCAGGGGGAGGMRLRTVCGSASPLNAPAPLQVLPNSFPITVGASGPGAPASGPGNPSQSGGQGSPSIFSTITSTGGGKGGAGHPTGTPTPSPSTNNAGGSGGSGGGGGHNSGVGGTGNSPPTAPPQGQDGAASVPVGDDRSGGGGGAGGVAATPAPGQAANGGAGSYIPTTFIGPTAPSYGETGPQGRFFAGGAGGTARTPSANPAGSGGLGGGADGVTGPSPGQNGSTNMGGGGSGGGSNGPTEGGGNGGSGIVMIRYKFQN